MNIGKANSILAHVKCLGETCDGCDLYKYEFDKDTCCCDVAIEAANTVIEAKNKIIDVKEHLILTLKEENSKLRAIKHRFDGEVK